MAATQGSFTIPAPKGVYQAAGDTNVSPDYAWRAENIRTEYGLLASACGTSRAFPSLGVAMETFTRFYRRSRPDDPDVYVAAGGGGVYTFTAGSDAWVRCPVSGADGAPEEDDFLCDRWSSVTYETQEDGQIVDVLIMSNPYDGMIVVSGSDLSARRMPLALGADGAQLRFAVLGRYAERIWGAGDPAHPDNIFYSRPYDPFDWTPEENSTASQGGGEIPIPTWDGDAFIALCPFGGYLLAVKRRSIFEIRGTDPDTFTIQQACGTDGPVQGATACVDRLGLYYLSHAGLGMYDGASLQLLGRGALHETLRLRMEGAQEEAVACVSGHVYYLALCVREAESDVITRNNAVIEYDMERGTFMLRRGLRVKDFYALDGTVYYTDADSPYEVLRYSDPDAQGYMGLPMACLWETPWLDLGKDCIKRDFVLRFTAEAGERDTPLTLTLITDRREKRKTVLLQPARRDYRVRIQNAGTRVRLRITSGAKAASWRITGGVEVRYAAEEE